MIDTGHAGDRIDMSKAQAFLGVLYRYRQLPIALLLSSFADRVGFTGLLTAGS